MLCFLSGKGDELQCAGNHVSGQDVHERVANGAFGKICGLVDVVGFKVDVDKLLICAGTSRHLNFDEETVADGDHVCFLSGRRRRGVIDWHPLCRPFKARVNCRGFAVCHRRRSRCAHALARVCLMMTRIIGGVPTAQSWWG